MRLALAPALAAALAPAFAAALAAPAAAQDLTLEEKAAQLQNAAPAEPKLGLPAYDWWNEGLHGLARNGAATVFPQAIGLAATWDAALLTRVGDVVATEARAKWNARPRGAGSGLFEGLTIWSPNINIFRDPRWGRGQETYGEDPLLSGRLGAAFVRGLQGPDPAHPKVVATPKHLVAHSGPEGGRDGFSVQVAPRDLEETYLPAFRIAVTEGRAMSLMCAYNGVHGTPVCALPSLMIDRLRRDWGFTGLTVSDCDAVGNIWQFQYAARDAAQAAAMALKGGTDLNCGTTYAALPDAVRRGLVAEATVDAALARAVAMRRVLAAPSAWDRIAPAAVGAPAHRALAREAAEKSIVLLRNDAGLLPLSGRRVAVIGANADDLGVVEANYHGTAIRPVTPLAGIRARFPGATYAQGSVLADGSPVVVPETALSAAGRPGLAVRIVDAVGRVTTRRDRTIDLNLTKTAPFRATWTGTFTPPGPGDYRLVLGGPACWHACPPHDAIRLWIGDERRIDGTIGERALETVVRGGAPVPIRIEIDHRGGDEGVRLQWLPPAGPLLAEAERAARDADVVVAVVGLSPDLEGEALKVAVPGFALGDRTEVLLPEPQRRLLDRLAATGKPLVVVVAAGSAVALGGVRADAILYAWYPGVEGGTALARILAGDVSPSGRMPVTVYASTADLPAFVDYGMKERTYRFFTGTPEWRFGHGRGYTDFAYTAPRPPAGVAAGATVTVAVPVRNTGRRAAEEVVQAYLVPPAPAGRPGLTDPVLQHQLAAFVRVALRPGETRDATLAIDARRMSTVDRDGVRRVVPGDYRLWIGGGQPGDAPGVWTAFTVTGPARELPK
ncbi:glycoside hydrolase family 3 [Sphingomonas sp. Leaf412]|uniref:glycoside hydrolase family 3 C-terminal domain-containing protein n=1 Tax=Sphingomonas sp. Leaf412 TaxID=1736370 RepID=UPI0006F92CD3|nr:glycoside hydrolase family 3 C-terminal domain-containing protein [Sphingomonas sp. Leaf412]KQT34631.1 glycoside hydrolase family 3 [Sphingomonas sp. Leaf412]